MFRKINWPMAILALGCAVFAGMLAAFALPGRARVYAPITGADVGGSVMLAGESWLLDINAAGADELAQLPGIGDTLAARIVEYREEFGPFADVGALQDVSGIGEGKLTAIEPYITALEPAADPTEDPTEE